MTDHKAAQIGSPETKVADTSPVSGPPTVGPPVPDPGGASTSASSPATAEAPPPDRNAIDLYLYAIGQIPLASKEEEVALAHRIRKGDEEARMRLIKANLRLVVKIAHVYSNFGLPLLDLISEGNIGLMKAVERFQPEKGGKLSTYAAWWIKQSIKRALANQSKTIRLPVHLVDKISKLRKVALSLTEELGREPFNEELAHEMGMSANKVAHLRSVSVRPTSLDAPVGDPEGTEFGDLVGDEAASNPFEHLRNKSLILDIKKMVEQLDDREGSILRMRFGLDGDKPKTLEEVGHAFNITRERVRQLQNIALNRMRRSLTRKEKQRSAAEVKDLRLQKERMAVLQEFTQSIAEEAKG